MLRARAYQDTIKNKGEGSKWASSLFFFKRKSRIVTACAQALCEVFALDPLPLLATPKLLALVLIQLVSPDESIRQEREREREGVDIAAVGGRGAAAAGRHGKRQQDGASGGGGSPARAPFQPPLLEPHSNSDPAPLDCFSGKKKDSSGFPAGTTLPTCTRCCRSAARHQQQQGVGSRGRRV